MSTQSSCPHEIYKPDKGRISALDPSVRETLYKNTFNPKLNWQDKTTHAKAGKKCWAIKE